MQALLALGYNEEAIPQLQELVERFPLRERLHENLMLGLYRSDRQAEALRAYRRVEDVFIEMGLEPGPALRRLEEKILLRDESLVGAEKRHNLPVELTSFIGRDKELTEALKLLSEHRMVTLTGVGGLGKTRLAYRVVAGTLDDFPDGCCVIELAPLRDPDLVVREMAATVGLQPQSDGVSSRWRYWNRTSDLCRVKVAGGLVTPAQNQAPWPFSLASYGFSCLIVSRRLSAVPSVMWTRCGREAFQR